MNCLLQKKQTRTQPDRNEINNGVQTSDAAIEEGTSVEKEESLTTETDHHKPEHIVTHKEDTFDWNPSPPKSKTVIKENFGGETDATPESETQQTAEQDVALSSKESFELNPSPPKADTTIGNA